MFSDVRDSSNDQKMIDLAVVKAIAAQSLPTFLYQIFPDAIKTGNGALEVRAIYYGFMCVSTRGLHLKRRVLESHLMAKDAETLERCAMYFESAVSQLIQNVEMRARWAAQERSCEASSKPRELRPLLRKQIETILASREAMFKCGRHIEEAVDAAGFSLEMSDGEGWQSDFVTATYKHANGEQTDHQIDWSSLFEWQQNPAAVLAKAHGVSPQVIMRWLSQKSVYQSCSHPGCKRQVEVTQGKEFFNGRYDYPTPDVFLQAERQAAQGMWYCHSHQMQGWQAHRFISPTLVETLISMETENWRPPTAASLRISKSVVEFLTEIGLIKVVKTSTHPKNPVRILGLTTQGEQYLSEITGA